MGNGARPARYALAGSVAALVVGVALTATNVVPPTRAGSSVPGTPTANQLKPSACASLNLTTVLVGAGAITGTGAAELVLGSAGVDTVRGGAGNDCLVGGAGNDSLRGDGGTDVCIGGAGTDTFHSTCEMQIQ
jgi:Ca2+-binding RTX toxin-like protein